MKLISFFCISSTLYLGLLHAAAQDKPLWQLNEALCVAASEGNESEVDRLLKAQAQPNAPASAFGETALHCATAAGHLPIVRLLLACGADPNVQSCVGETSLHWATEYSGPEKEGCVEIVQALIEAEVDVNSKEALEGNTGLHRIAINDGMPNRYAFHIIKILLDAGAHKEEQNMSGFTPSEKAYAAWQQSKKVDSAKAYMLASRAAFLRIYPPETSDEEAIISLLFQRYSFDAAVAAEALDRLETLYMQDIHAYHRFEPYLHDDE